MTNLEWIKRMPAGKLARYLVMLQNCNAVGSGCECSKCLLFDVGDFDHPGPIMRCSNPEDVKKWLYMEHNSTKE